MRKSVKGKELVRRTAGRAAKQELELVFPFPWAVSTTAKTVNRYAPGPTSCNDSMTPVLGNSSLRNPWFLQNTKNATTETGTARPATSQREQVLEYPLKELAFRGGLL